MLLRVEGVSKHYGGLRAVDDLTFSVHEREIFGIVGPNGAGKTTLFDLLSGVARPSSGGIFLHDEPVHGLTAPKLCRRGVARTFQTPALFATQTTFRNAVVGALFGSAHGAHRDAAYGLAHDALQFVGLREKADAPAGELGVLDQKRLMLASALASQPEVLLLDEPMGGLTRDEMLEASELVRKVNEAGITVLLIEHVMEAVLRLSNRVMVLHHGKELFNGLPSELVQDPEVRRVYLGLAEVEAIQRVAH